MTAYSYAEWIGRTLTQRQTVETWPVAGLLAAMDSEPMIETGQDVPHLAQWLFFGPMVPHSKIGADGHPERGGFLPPISLPRRMWAASDITFDASLRIGDLLEKTARIADISLKEGKSGALIFVKVENTYTVNGHKAVGELQTLVYRDHPAADEAPAPTRPASEAPAWSRRIETDPALLFRYSAVTFNAHRIHYDVPYARNEEGYPNIVVQGQLTATIMLREFLRIVSKPAKSFSFRAVKPIFCGDPFFVEGKPDQNGRYVLWARDEDGNLAMTGNVSI